MTINVLEGKLVVKNKKAAIVVSRFNEFITSKLLAGAIDALKRHDVKEENITVAWVPGAFEIPYTAKKLVETSKYDGVICLGALIRGATPHFDYISNESAKGVAQLAMQSKIPVVYGIITCDTLEQAIERAGTKSGNKGYDAGLSLLEMMSLFENF